MSPCGRIYLSAKALVFIIVPLFILTCSRFCIQLVLGIKKNVWVLYKYLLLKNVTKWPKSAYLQVATVRYEMCNCLR